MTDYKIALSFEDGVTRFITCKDNQTIADAAYRQRMNIPLDCNDGACGTCKSFNDSGEFDPGYYVDDALTEDELKDGYLLTCQAKPKSDMVIQIASTSAVAKTTATTYHATVTEVHRYSSTVMRLRVTIPNRGELAFLPGQYVNIVVPGGEDTRSYSFSSAPEDEVLEFMIKIVPGGLMSEWLSKKAKVGDKFDFTGPHGSFFLREALRPALLVAGGTGLAPIVSMLRSARDSGTSRRFHMVYGANTDEDIIELETIEQLTKDIPNFTWDYVVGDPASKAKNKGYVMTIINAEHLASGDATIYLCGPPPMVEAVRGHVKDLGVEPYGFFYEKFTSAVKAAPAAAAAEASIADAPPEAIQAAAAQEASRRRPAARDLLQVGDEARGLVGQSLFPLADLAALQNGQTAEPHAPEVARSIVGQVIYSGGDPASAGALDSDAGIAPSGASTGILGQEIFSLDEIESVGGSEPAGIAASYVPVAESDYEIGEEHPSILKSDALFEAREALELGALELTMGRLDSRQIAGYRMLAEATIPYIKGDQFVDALGFTESNAAFHDYLFTLTNNDHLLQAYQRLGVKGAMEETLKHAHWCHPLIAKDHIDMVDAIEKGDRERARQLFIGHADRSKQTMRRAMKDQAFGGMPISPGRFAGKVVVITGAAQGIGEAVAKRVHAEGGDLVLADLSDLVNGVASHLSETGHGAISTLANMETYEGAKAVVDAAIKKHGRIDVAIHVVGGTIWRKPFEQYAEDEIEKEIRRSLFPTLWACRAVLPHMYEQGKGTIVNVSSVATNGLNRLPYAAAKGGVNALTRSLAWEAAEHGVRVTATAPGGTEAPPRKIPRGGEPSNAQEEAWHQVTVDQTIGSSLQKRYGSLDEQAAAICFLASDEASYITGTVLPVAGGDLG